MDDLKSVGMKEVLFIKFHQNQIRKPAYAGHYQPSGHSDRANILENKTGFAIIKGLRRQEFYQTKYGRQ
jgi:hypothetical protein